MTHLPAGDPGGQDERWLGPVADQPWERGVLGSEHRFSGRVWSVRTDRVDFDGHVAHRDILLHLGAVAVIALDASERVLLIRQYRHPVGMYLFEPPAGLLDVPGEPPQATAARELAEEAGYAAGRWDVLVDLLNSPGGSSEAIRVYLARDLVPLDAGRPRTGEAEESHLPQAWVRLDDARDLVLAGQVGCVSAVCGILAAWSARQEGWRSLRPADAPWPARAAIEGSGRVHQGSNLSVGPSGPSRMAGGRYEGRGSA